MSLNTRKSSGGTYLKIYGGKIVRESSKPFESDDPVKERENKNGNKVYYTEYDSVSGKLLGAVIESVESLGLEVIHLSLQDGPEYYTLSIPADGRFGKSFMMRAPNLDLSKEVEIVPYSFSDKDGKKVAGLNVFQSGSKVMPAYTKENPNGLPDARQVRKGKEIKWDFTDQTNFLYDEFEKFSASFPKKTEQEPVKVNTAAEEDDFDDLPF